MDLGKTDVEAWEAAGLYDPAAPDAADRRALLEFLAGQGLSLDRLVEAHGRGQLVPAALDAALDRGPALPVEEVAQLAGTSPALVRRVWQALGLPDERHGSSLPLTEKDVPAFVAFTLGVELFGEDAVLQFTRVLGSALSRVAEAAVALFLLELERPLTEAGGSPADLARAYLDAVASLGGLPDVMEAMFAHHMNVAVRRLRVSRTEGRAFETATMAVGFVDLVGYTPLSLEMAPRELSEFVTSFESRAADIVTARDGRVVKLIGDEVMFVVVDPVAGCEVGLSLMEAFGAVDPRIRPRGGIGYGDLLTQHGDYYGPVVNLASRAADVAVPDELLATAELADRVGEDSRYSLEPAGRRLLKGFEEPVSLFSLSRPG